MSSTTSGAAFEHWRAVVAAGAIAWFLLGPSVAFAQVEVSVGASIGRGCKEGFEPCGGPLVGAQGGIWIGERFGLRMRVASIRSDDLRRDYDDFTVTRGDRTRLLVTGEFLYRFLRKRQVQPIVGIAIGGRQNRHTISCEHVSCAEAKAVLGDRFPWTDFRWHSSRGVVAGVLFKPVPRLTIEGLIGLHDYPTEHGATAEATFLVGVGLWRSRATR